jgi:hypothetical protein
MSPLERRCRLLLRAYPGGYRRERGEEIIATLLEATPEGRRRPLARDVRALIMGGLRARAAQHRGVTTAVSLRRAVLAGACIYLGMAAAADLARFAAGWPDGAGFGLDPYGWPVFVGGWPVLLAGLLTAVVVAVAWLARRLLVMAASLAAAAAAAYLFVHGERTSYLVTQVVCLAAVAALAGRTGHRSPAWLWLIGTVVAALVLGSLPRVISMAYSWWDTIALGVYLAVIVVAVAWVAIDARPLAMVAAYNVLWLVPPMLVSLAAGFGNWLDIPVLLAVAAIAALAVWRLRRQSLRPGPAAQ